MNRELSPRELRQLLLSDDIIVQAYFATSEWVPLGFALAAAGSYKESLYVKAKLKLAMGHNPSIDSEAQKCVEHADKLFDHAILYLFHFLKEMNNDGCGECPACKFKAKIEETLTRQNASQN